MGHGNGVNIKDIKKAIYITSDEKQWRDIFTLQEDVGTLRLSRPTL